MADNDLINVVKLIPVLILLVDVTVERFELRTARDS